MRILLTLLFLLFSTNVYAVQIGPQPYPFDKNAVTQDVIVSSTNSSTANLSASATFTGTSQSTLGVNAIQVTLKTDQNCTVYVDQSPDGTNWDISDSFNYLVSINNFSTTVQAVNSYVRVRVTNLSTTTATTYFRLQTVLCPIVEALPRSLDENGHLVTAVHVIKDEYGFESENTPNGEMRMVEPTLLVGKIFEGIVLDTNYWTSTITNAGSVTQSNDEATIATNTTANGTAKLNSVRRAGYKPGQAHVARFQLRLNNTGVASNIRKWGVGYGVSMPTISDGAYFQLSGTTFSIVTLKGSSATTVSSGSFNGEIGSTYALDTNYHTYEIYYNNRYVFFTIDGKVLHTVEATSASWAGTVQHHIYLESSNSGGITSNNTLVCSAAGIRRLGKLLNQPIYKYQSGTTATGLVCKYGTGNIHGIAVSNITNNAVITLYDNTGGSGTVIWSSGAMSNQTIPFDIPFHGIPFFTGLTMTITGANCDVNLQYE